MPLPTPLPIPTAVGETYAMKAMLVCGNALAWMTDLNIGVLVSGITALGTAGIYLYERAAKARVTAYREWLEVHKGSMADDLQKATAEMERASRELDVAREEIVDLKGQVAQLSETVRRREEFIFVLDRQKDRLYQQVMTLSVRQTECHGNVIHETSESTILLDDSGDPFSALPDTEGAVVTGRMPSLPGPAPAPAPAPASAPAQPTPDPPATPPSS